jgi:predicted  nucleic acid-binding Zn-ribbon protein
MRIALLAAAAVVCLTGGARAQDSPEDRLRAALKQSVQEMRAAQDQAADLQAKLTQAQSDLAATKAQLDAANQKLAGGVAKPKEVEDLKAQLQSAQQQNAALQGSLRKFQGAVAEAQGFARQRERESRIATAGLQSNTKALETCKAFNTKLIAVAEDTLHLYQKQSFRSILLRSYEPFIGSAKVDLENIVQDYDNKIHDQEYIPPPSAPGATH